MSSTADRVDDLFTKISHQRNISVVYPTQNIFYKSKQSRMLSLNSYYLVLLKNARDASQVVNLARQIYPEKSALMVKLKAYKNDTSISHGYLLTNLKHETNKKFRLMAGLIPWDDLFAYVRK